MKKQTIYIFIKSIHLLLFVLFLSGIQTLKAGDGDKPKKSKFDLNDPRNPDCPCHKYQKIADEEYFKLLKEQRKTGSNTGNLVSTGGGGTGEINKKKHSGHNKLFKHRRNQYLFFLNKGNGRCKKRRHHFNGDISSCFRWK